MLSKPAAPPPTAVPRSSPSAQLPHSVFRQMPLSTYLSSLYLLYPLSDKRLSVYPFTQCKAPTGPSLNSLCPIQSRPGAQPANGSASGRRIRHDRPSSYFFTAGCAALGAAEETVASAFNLFSTASPMPFTFFSSSTDLNAPFF